MKTVFILAMMCFDCAGTYMGVDGKEFTTREECYNFARERIEVNNFKGDWWCQRMNYTIPKANHRIDLEK